MSKITTLEKITKVLFSDIDDIRGHRKEIGEIVLTPAEERKLIQYRAGFVFWLEKPELSDKLVSEYLKNSFEISGQQSYEIIFALKSILGNVRNASKEWNRYTVIEMAKKSFALAQTKEDFKGMALAAAVLGKYTKLDKNEDEEIPYDQIIPPTFEPSYDINILDPKLKIEDLNEKRRKLREKYKGNTEIEEAQIVD